MCGSGETNRWLLPQSGRIEKEPIQSVFWRLSFWTRRVEEERGGRTPTLEPGFIKESYSTFHSPFRWLESSAADARRSIDLLSVTKSCSLKVQLLLNFLLSESWMKPWNVVKWAPHLRRRFIFPQQEKTKQVEIRRWRVFTCRTENFHELMLEMTWCRVS